MADVTIVVPMHNTEAYISEAISSLVSNEFGAHLIVVDDGSTDNSVEEARGAIKGLGISADVIVLEENEGPSSARNLGVSLCRTPYVTFLDSDDLMSIGTTQWAISKLNEDAGLDIVVMAGQSFKDSTWHVQNFNDWPLRVMELPQKELVTDGNKSPWLPILEPSAATKVFRVEFLREKEISFPLGLRFEDFGHHWLSMALARRVLLSTRTQVFARQGRKGQMTATRSMTRFDVLQVWDEAQRRLVGSDLSQNFGAHSLWSALRASSWCSEHLPPGAHTEYWSRAVEIWVRSPFKWREAVIKFPLTQRERMYYNALQRKNVFLLTSLSLRSLNWRNLPEINRLRKAVRGVIE